MVELAWLCAMTGVVLGGLAALVPGFPGSAVALLGLVAFASLTDFRIVTPPVLVIGALVAGVAALTQLAGPVVASRAAGGTAGAATGAALGAAVGALIPLPAAAWVASIVGALVVGGIFGREGVVRWTRGVLGTATGCLVGVAADLLGVLGIAALLALADFLALP